MDIKRKTSPVKEVLAFTLIALQLVKAILDLIKPFWI